MIAGSRHVPPQPWAVPKLMEDYGRWLTSESQGLHPVVRAAEAHERLVTIHPFIDGNGRTARLAMNLILLANGYSIANIPGDTTAAVTTTMRWKRPIWKPTSRFSSGSSPGMCCTGCRRC